MFPAPLSIASILILIYLYARTPLTLVIGPLDDVLGGKEPLAPATRELLSMVRRHANRLLGMVNKVRKVPFHTSFKSGLITMLHDLSYSISPRSKDGARRFASTR